LDDDLNKIVKNDSLDKFEDFDRLLNEAQEKINSRGKSTLSQQTNSRHYPVRTGFGNSGLLPEDYLQEEVFFLRRELDNKQSIIEKLLGLLEENSEKLNHGLNFSLKSDDNFDVKGNVNFIPKPADSISIIENDFLTPMRPITVKKVNKMHELYSYPQEENLNETFSSNYISDTSVEQLLNDSHDNETNLIAINNQLKEYRQKHINKSYYKQKTVIKTTTEIDNESVSPWKNETTLVVGDSILNGLDEQRMTASNNVKVRCFPGATVDDMNDYIKPLMKKKPKTIIFHVGTNNDVNETSGVILEKILTLKKSVEFALPTCKVILSTLINRTDNAKAAVTVNNLNRHLKESSLDLINNSNVAFNCLGRRGLHLNNLGTGKLAINIINFIRKIKLRD
jgi:hypothetical protein